MSAFRRIIWPAVPVIWLLCLHTAFATQPSQTTQNGPNSQDLELRRTPVVRAVEKAAPAVVNITALRSTDGFRGRSRNPLGRFLEDLYGITPTPTPRTTGNLGTGVIIDGKRGLVLTNAHVIAEARDVTVRLLDGREFKADLVGSDPDFDLAVLKLEKAGDLPGIKMAEDGRLMIGETVVAIGNPYGYSHTVTTGVVSALNRSVKTEDGLLTDFIQTDAAINPGNSGGPLLNITGELIGITTAIQSNAEGIGFAIPIAKARRVVDELLTEGHVTPVWLGLSGQNVDQRIANYFGLDRPAGMLITAAYPGSPAERAGLNAGDIILAVDSSRIKDKTHFLDILKNVTKGRELVLTVLHEGERTSVRLQPVPLDQDTVLALAESRWGMVPNPKPMEYGLLLTRIRPGSPAERLKLMPGDVLVQVGGTRLTSMDDFVSAYQSARMNNMVLIRIARNGRLYYAKMVL